jgi:hypothetical protein
MADIKELKAKLDDQKPTNVTNNISIGSVRIKYIKNAIINNINHDPIYKLENGQKKYSEFMIDCVMRQGEGVSDMIKKVYFNEDYPENCVIYMDEQDVIDDTLKIFDGEDWFKEKWSDVCTLIIPHWGGEFDDCYCENSDYIQSKFGGDSDDYETMIASRIKRLEVEGYTYNANFSDVFKDDLKKGFVLNKSVVEKVHGYVPVATIQ